MKLSEREVLDVARLARLRLSEGEVTRYLHELDSILTYMDMLGEVDTAGIEPTVHVHPVTNALRPDLGVPSQDIADALGNAPVVHGNAFEVPRVIEED